MSGRRKILARKNLKRTKNSYLLLCLIALFAIAGSTLYADRRFIDAYNIELRDSLTTILNTTQAALDLLTTDHQRTTELMAENPELLPIVEELLALPRNPEALLANQEKVRNHFAWLYQSGRYKGFFIIAPDLTNLASSRNNNVGPKNILASQPDMLEQLFSGKAAISHPMKSDVPLKNASGELVEDAPTMFAGAPIRDSSGKIIALLTLRLDPLEKLLPVIEASRFASTGESYLIDRNGLMLSHSRFERDLYDLGLLAPGQSSLLNLQVRDPGADLTEGNTAAVPRAEQPLTVMATDVTQGYSGINLDGYRDYRGRLVVGAWSWDTQLNAGIAVEADLDQVLVPVRQSRMTIVVFSLSSALLLVIMTAFGIVSTRRYEVSESRLKSVLDNLLDCIIVINEQGIIQSANQAVEKTFGYNEAELVGKNVSILMPEPYHSEHDGYLSRYVRGGAPHIIGSGREVSAVHKEGHVFPIELGVNEMYLSGKRHFTGIIRDISTRKEIEASLEQERQFNRRTLDAMAQEIAVLGEKGHIIYVNEAWNRYARTHSKDMPDSWIGLDYREAAISALGLDDKKAGKAGLLLYAMLRGEITHFSKEISSRQGDKPRWFALRASIFRQSGHTRVVVVHQDITERKKQAKILEEARDIAENATRAKTAFLAAMSHEIRTPMNGIVGTLDILKRSDLSETQKELTDIIKESGFVLLSIIDDILDFSKVEAGRMQLEQKPVLFLPLVEGTIESLMPVAEKKKLEILIDCDPQIPAVSGDSVRLRQILTNLVGNAIKFTESRENKQGRILVTISQQQLGKGRVSVLLQVADNGIGIGRKAQTMLFKPFSQAENSTSRRYGGTGLGLSICDRLVKLMGGNISLESEEGIGTTFSVNITFDIAPLADEGRQFDLSDISVLLLGSDDKVTEIVHHYLEASGAEIVEASEDDITRQAEAILDRQSSLIVVLDSPRDSSIAEKVKARIKQKFPDHEFRYMIISRGKRRRPRMLDEETLTMDANAMHYKSLIRGVAAAMGRVSMELPPPGQEGSNVPEIVMSTGHEHRILIAEDNETNRKVLSFQVNMLGYQADIVESGIKAMQALQKNSYSLLITDCHMPDMDGYELARTIRKQETGDEHLPILAITADAMRGAREKCLEAGMDDYLTKPLQMDDLKETLHNLLMQEELQEMENEGADASSHPAAGTINPDTLRQALNTDDAGTLRDFYTDYLESSEQCVEGIRLAHKEHDSSQVSALGHRLKSSSRMVGAEALADVCEKLQAAGSREDWKSIDSCVESINLLFPQAAAWIDDFCKK